MSNLLTPAPFAQVTKAEIQDGLCAADPTLGERACVYGPKCISITMCQRYKELYPTHYAHAQPFVCKEFYFGTRGEVSFHLVVGCLVVLLMIPSVRQAVRSAMANGRSLSELLNGTAPVMCVLCHLSWVTQWHKTFDLELTKDPPHILHAFRVSAGVPGGYPGKKCFLGDPKFKGIIAPFPRFSLHNYIWEPAGGTAERDVIVGKMGMSDGTAINRWLERSEMDFL